MNHPQHKINLDYIIFWSSIITFLVLSHKANGILTDSNHLHCTNVQCPTKCPEDSYLKSTLDAEEDDFEDYEDGFISHFEELPSIMEVHEEHPEHIVKERQKREVFFQGKDIEECCDNQKCVCNKCQDVPKCFEGYVAVEIHEGQGVPGNCCSLYQCIKKEECQLGVKHSWWISKCQKCFCFGESELCTQICPEEEIVQSCYSEYWQKPMLNGATWKEGPCTNCTCENGERRCFTPVCPKLDCKHIVTFEDECCPKCIGDGEVDEHLEIVPNKEEDIDEVSEDYTTETLKITASAELNSTVGLINTSTEIVDLNDSITTSPIAEFDDNATTTISERETSPSPTTLETETSTFTPTPLPNVEDVTTHESSTLSTSTLSEEILVELDSTTKSLVVLDLDSTTTTEVLRSQADLQENSTTFVSSTTAVTTAASTKSEFNEEPTTQNNLDISTSTEKVFSTSISSTSTETVSQDNVFIDSNSSLSNITSSLETTTSSSTTQSNTVSMEVAKTIASSQMPTVESIFITESPLNSTTTKSSVVTATTSTTSSPFTSTTLETSSVNPDKLEETSSTSTTTAPELFKPLYQLYDDFDDSNEHVNTSTRNQMRIIFDEIDYVVMIALFIGSLICIALGLIIRHTKNRKKMYSSIPNSETSLSQTSTVLTV